MLLGIVNAVNQPSERSLYERVAICNIVGATRNEQVGMVEDIEEFSPQLQLFRFIEIDVAEQMFHVWKPGAR